MKNGKTFIGKTVNAAISLLLAFVFAAAVFASACSAKNGGKTEEGRNTAVPASAEPTGTPFAQTEPPATEPAETEPAATEAPTQKPRTAEALFGDVVLARQTDLNYFAIPDIILSLMTDADIELYKRMVTAFMAGETSVEVPAELGEYPNIYRVLDMYCPVFFIDVDDTKITDDGRTISWSYADPAAHGSAIDRFEAKVREHLSSVVESDIELAKILTVYKDFTSGLTYNEETANGGFRYRHGVNAIMEGLGVCWCFARGFNFLICQLGVTSLTIHGIREWDNAVHEWVVFKDGGEWRYCDPTWDIGGHSLNYFGFTMKVRDNNGFPRSHVTVLEGTKYKASDYFKVSDPFFAPLYTGACYGGHYEIDHENSRILFSDDYDYTSSGKWRVFELLTGNFYLLDEYPEN